MRLERVAVGSFQGPWAAAQVPLRGSLLSPNNELHPQPGAALVTRGSRSILVWGFFLRNVWQRGSTRETA